MGKTLAQLESETIQTPPCKVALVEAEDVDMVWDETYPLIEKALRYAEGELIPEDIKTTEIPSISITYSSTLHR